MPTAVTTSRARGGVGRTGRPVTWSTGIALLGDRCNGVGPGVSSAVRIRAACTPGARPDVRIIRRRAALPPSATSGSGAQDLALLALELLFAQQARGLQLT